MRVALTGAGDQSASVDAAPPRSLGAGLSGLRDSGAAGVMTADEVREKLRPIIAELGQRKVAAAAGITQPALSFWLSGKRGTLHSTVSAVAAACGYRLGFTLEEDREAGLRCAMKGERKAAGTRSSAKR